MHLRQEGEKGWVRLGASEAPVHNHFTLWLLISWQPGTEGGWGGRRGKGATNTHTYTCVHVHTHIFQKHNTCAMLEELMLAQSCPHLRSCPKAGDWTLSRRCYASGVLELSSFSLTTSVLRAPNYLWSHTCDPSHLALPPFSPCCPLVSPIPKPNGQFCLMWNCTLVCFIPRL